MITADSRQAGTPATRSEHVPIPLLSLWERLLARPGLALGLILALALLLRLININRNMWVDELITWNAIQLPFREMVTERFRCGHLPAYYTLMHFWPGQNPGCAWLLRLPSIFFGLLAIALTYRLGRLGYRPKVALGGALLLTLHSGALWSSQVVRAYSLLMTLNLAAAIAFLRFTETRKARYGVGLFAATLIGYLTQVQYFFTLLAQLIYLAWTDGRRCYRQWPVLAVLALATLTAFPAYQRLGHEQKEMENKILPSQLSLGGFGDAVAGLLVGEFKFAGLYKKAAVPAEILALAIVLLTLRGYGKGERLRQLADEGGESNADAKDGAAAPLARARALTRYLVCWAGIQFMVLFLYLKVIPLNSQGLRYYWAFMGGVSLSLAAALSLIRPVALRRGLALLTIAFMLVISVRWLQNPGDGIFSAIPYLEKKIQAGEPLIGLDGLKVSNCLRFANTRLQAGYRPLDREIEDSRQVLDAMRRQTAAAPSFWLMVYHPQDSPALKAIDDSGAYRLLESRKFHETKIYHYARK